MSLDYLMREGEDSLPSEKTPKRSGKRRIITALCLIAAAVLAFALVGVLCALNALASASQSLSVQLDGVGVIVVLAVLCAATGIALLISLKK